LRGSPASCFLPFQPDLIPARFRRRFNRFLVEAETEAGVVEAHLADPGRLLELLRPGADCRLRPERAAGRRTAFTVALVHADGVWVSVDTNLPNRLVETALRAGAIHEFRDYSLVRREVRLGRSRFDFHLMSAGMDVLLEVKSVTLVRDGVALFPDAPTARGARHLQALQDAAAKGFLGTVLFLVQRSDAREMRPHAVLDPGFAQGLAEAYRRGIEVLAYAAVPEPAGIRLAQRLPVVLPPYPPEAPG